MARVRWAVLGAVLAAACGGPPQPGAQPGSPGTVAPSPALPAPPATGAPGGTPPAAPQAVAPPPAEPPVVVPAGALYACVAAAANGERQVSAIELAPQVSALCARNPEMGPCQYAREACRHGGGRVFAANGQEITRATEAEYDKRVFRVRLRSG